MSTSSIDAKRIPPKTGGLSRTSHAASSATRTSNTPLKSESSALVRANKVTFYSGETSHRFLVKYHTDIRKFRRPLPHHTFRRTGKNGLTQSRGIVESRTQPFGKIAPLDHNVTQDDAFTLQDVKGHTQTLHIQQLSAQEAEKYEGNLCTHIVNGKLTQAIGIRQHAQGQTQFVLVPIVPLVAKQPVSSTQAPAANGITANTTLPFTQPLDIDQEEFLALSSCLKKTIEIHAAPHHTVTDANATLTTLPINILDALHDLHQRIDQLTQQASERYQAIRNTSPLLQKIQKSTTQALDQHEHMSLNDIIALAAHTQGRSGEITYISARAQEDAALFAQQEAKKIAALATQLASQITGQSTQHNTAHHLSNIVATLHIVGRIFHAKATEYFGKAAQAHLVIKDIGQAVGEQINTTRSRFSLTEKTGLTPATTKTAPLSTHRQRAHYAAQKSLRPIIQHQLSELKPDTLENINGVRITLSALYQQLGIALTTSTARPSALNANDLVPLPLTSPHEFLSLSHTQSYEISKKIAEQVIASIWLSKSADHTEKTLPLHLQGIYTLIHTPTDLAHNEIVAHVIEANKQLKTLTGRYEAFQSLAVQWLALEAFIHTSALSETHQELAQVHQAIAQHQLDADKLPNLANTQIHTVRQEAVKTAISRI